MDGVEGYRLTQRIALGQSSEVYLGVDRHGNTCVVKRARDSSDLSARAMVAREARALSEVHDAHVVTWLATLEDAEGGPLMVLEHLAGPTLSTIVADHGPAPWTWVVELLRAIARGLAAIHAAGYLHGDVKPANILCPGFAGFAQPPNAKLIDLGLAEPISSQPGSVKEGPVVVVGSVMGTRGYVAPERLRGGALDPRSDLYGLGVVAFELLTGVSPFRGAASVEHRLPRLIDAHPSVVVPGELERIVESLLASDPEARPASADALVRRLDGVELATTMSAVAPDLSLAALAKHVRESWLVGVLDASTEGLTLVPQARTLTGPGVDGAVALAGQASLLREFERGGRRLQIVGPAGYGKTVQMLKLVRPLLDEHLRARERPVPVVFSMSEWQERDASLADFMVRELAGKYALPAAHARRFVDEGRILPVLDALDEVAPSRREQAIRAVNEHLVADSGRPVLLSCRTGIPGLSGRVAIATTVELGPLTRTETARYLGGEWRRLGSLLDHDPELEQLSTTPLMLQLLRVSVRDRSFNERTESDEEPVQWLFRRYVSTVVAGPRGVNIDERRLWSCVGSAARTLRRSDRSMLVFEELQPSALAHATLRRVYLWGSRLSVSAAVCVAAIPAIAFSPLENDGFAVTLPFALSLVVATTLIAGVGFSVWSLAAARWRRSLMAVLGWGLGLGCLVGATLWPIAQHRVVWVLAIEGALVCAMVLGVSRRARSFPNDDIATVESLRWDLRGVSPRNWGLLLVSALLVFLAVAQIESKEAALQVSTIVALLGGSILASRHARIAEKIVPNMGIHRSLRSAALAAGLGFTVSALSLGLSYGVGYAVVGGAFVATIGGLWFGGVDGIQHYLLRMLLALEGSLQLRPGPALDDAVHLGFLRRVGNGYMFAHKSLRDYFAHRTET